MPEGPEGPPTKECPKKTPKELKEVAEAGNKLYDLLASGKLNNLGKGEKRDYLRSIKHGEYEISFSSGGDGSQLIGVSKDNQQLRIAFEVRGTGFMRFNGKDIAGYIHRDTLKDSNELDCDEMRGDLKLMQSKIEKFTKILEDALVADNKKIEDF